MIITIVVLIALFYTVLNTSMLGDQAKQWVKDNPKDAHAPIVLYYTARWCDIIADNRTALNLYWTLYQQYPEKSDLCAAALYYSAQIIVQTSAAKKQANDFLKIIMDQYPSENEWVTKAHALFDEVNFVH